MGYAHPDTLVGTDWLADRLDDPEIRIVEAGLGEPVFLRLSLARGLDVRVEESLYKGIAIAGVFIIWDMVEVVP